VLRDYQERAIADLRKGIANGVRRQVLVSPTGSGKTTIAASMIHRAIQLGKRVIFIAHRKELIDQASSRLSAYEVPHGIIMAGHPRTDAPVQVCSIQTLVRREPPPADLIFVDECHHARAATYEKILGNYPNAAVIGMTATPWRLDGKGLGELFSGNVIAATPSELIENGHLCKIQGFTCTSPDLREIKTIAGDYDPKGLSLAYERSRVLGDILERWQERVPGKKTVVFAASIPNSLDIVTRFLAAGIAAEHLDYRTSKLEREGILARLRSGETLLVSNVGLLGEGVDIPDLEVCVIARPTKSLCVYLQMVGRIMRPAPGKEMGIVHDHGECVSRFGLPDDPRDYSLKQDKPEKPPVLHTCDKCQAIFVGLKCPVCGAWVPLDSKEGTERQGPDQMDDVVDVSFETIRAMQIIKDAKRSGVTMFVLMGKPQFYGAKEPLLRQLLSIHPDVAVQLWTDAGEVMPSRDKQLKTFRGLMENAKGVGYEPGWAMHRFLEQYPQASKPWGIWREMVDNETKTWRSGT
jgi:DNA repair protein RadD